MEDFARKRGEGGTKIAQAQRLGYLGCRIERLHVASPNVFDEHCIPYRMSTSDNQLAVG